MKDLVKLNSLANLYKSSLFIHYNLLIPLGLDIGHCQPYPARSPIWDADPNRERKRHENVKMTIKLIDDALSYIVNNHYCNVFILFNN